MSMVIIRRLLEQRLNTATAPLPTAWQNVPYTAQPGVPWQRINLLPARTENPTFGDAFKRETGIFQVTLAYGENAGPQTIEAKAEDIRALFPRGLRLTSGKVSVLIDEAPFTAPPFNDGGFFRLPVSVPWIADIYP